MDSDTESPSVASAVPAFSSWPSDDRQDVTQKFFEACKLGLDAGELCHNSWFTLLHSMSAIEVMDPKMDIRVQGARRVVSTTEAVATNTLPLDPFSDRFELIGVMDELLAATTNWLTGDSLAQSVFTCMYMHCTQLIRDPYLRSFCELLRRVINQIRQIIVSSSVFDEEDFYPPTNGMPLNGPSSMFDRFLDAETLNESLRFFSLTSDGLIEHTRNLVAMLHKDAVNTPEGVDGSVDALISRLEFPMKLLQFTNQICSYMNAAKMIEKSSEHTQFDVSEDNSVNEEDNRIDSITESGTFATHDFWSDLSAICSSTEPILIELTQLARTLIDTATIGHSSGQGRLFPKDHPYGLPGFEPFLNQTSLPSYIPRFVIIHDRNKAFHYINGLIENLLRITQTRLLVPKWHAFDPRNSALHLLWSFTRQHGQQTHSHVVRLLNSMQPQDTVATNGFHSELHSCLLSRALSCLLYCTPMRCQRAIGILPDISSTLQVELIVQSWLDLEAKKYHEPLREIISDVVGLKGFFDVLADHLIHIPYIYYLNRSRQRSALDRLLQKLPDLLTECCRVEWIMSLELAKKLDLGDNSNTGQKSTDTGSSETTVDRERPPYFVPLRLSSYVCYYYCQLAWDYLVTGFQLELYAAQEWAFIYTFMIGLFQNMAALFERFLTPDNNSTDNPEPPQSTKPQEAPARRSKTSNKKKSRRNKLSSTDEKNKSQSSAEKLPITPALRPCGPGSELEYLILNCHRSLIAGTIYALRALQLDSGGDPVLDFPSTTHSSLECKPFGNPEEIYSRRLGLFLAATDSPLSDPGGCAGAFQACKRHLTSGIFSADANHPTDDENASGQRGGTTGLYMLATHNFEDAQFRAQFAQATKAPMLVTLKKVTGVSLNDELFGQLFGTPDNLADLERLAAHNLIACRVLANCLDRRPTPSPKSDTQSGSAGTVPSFLSRSSPVKLDFSFLTSRTYPLIRLVSSQAKGDSKTT
ncbi:unnamed protein product [Echinostoma caproni]|uniref:Protein MAK10 homolog n=1 Tax=Echinostoma caproni TaxID=27848 RepID=A0A183APE6_9TREM|nr:unnamed protein product [Echinostoma caproni]